MIYLGNQTAKYASPIFAPFKYALAQGFSAFEWFADRSCSADGSYFGWTFADCPPAVCRNLHSLAAAGKIRFSVHAAWNADPRSNAGAAAISEALSFADVIGAPVVVVHLCKEMTEVTEFARALCEILISHTVSPTVAAEGECSDVKIAVENTSENSPAHFNLLFSELARLPGGERVGMTFDLGHANCCAATRNNYIKFLHELQPAVRIIHAHIHENWGDRDAHLPLFTGPAAENDTGLRLFADNLLRRGFSGSLIMEQWPEPPALLTAAAVRMKELLISAGAELAETAPVTAEDIAAFSTEIDESDKAAETAVIPENRSSVLSPELAAAVQPTEKNNIHVSFLTNYSSSTDAVEHYASYIVNSLAARTSWRTRLEWVRDTLAAPEFTATPEKIALIAALLRFLATGELPCAEDGGHYRPNHHAAAAAAIERALEQPDIPEWLRRRVYPWLPSHAAAYRVAEPLTRIRDIAHRNDIPHDLKLHIKHDLQNKLHRSAGPEDLRTAHEIFKRITAPGSNYSADFVAQFRIFVDELQHFFNIPDLGARLAAVSELCPDLAGICKEAGDGARPAEEQAASAVALRTQLAAALRTAAPENRQPLRLADIELENLIFIRLSEAAGEFTADTPLDARWFALTAIALANAALSESDVPEVAICAEEFAAWRKNFKTDSPLHWARMRATLLRVLRAAAAYQEKICTVFLPAASILGKKLHIDQYALDTFGEGTIRSGVMFQAAKLAEIGEARSRMELNLSPWSVIVPGTGHGVWRTAATLADIPAADPERTPAAMIVYLAYAAGDEEIPCGVRGIILAHPLPQLSHLAIRARQAGIILTAAETPAAFANLQFADGTPVMINADSSGMTVTGENKTAPAQKNTTAADFSRNGKDFSSLLSVSAVAVPAVFRGTDISAPTCGAKAAGIMWLQTQAGIAAGNDVHFAAPPAAVLPFGSMELALSQSPDKDEYERLVKKLAGASTETISACLPRLREIICGLTVPAEQLAILRAEFPGDIRLAVRSSSNGEDLPGLAGAGLYDSVVGVSPEALNAAITQVWASLWTERAALSRRAAGISQTAATMAVLVQPALVPDYSFVLHTADPLTGERGRVNVEIAVGLGETLASANQPGRPYHLSVPAPGAAASVPRLFTCADYSLAVRSGQNVMPPAANSLKSDGVAAERINYAHISLSAADGALMALAEKLGKIGRWIDAAAGCPQDIEGAITGEEIFIVQTRPQTGIN